MIYALNTRALTSVAKFHLKLQNFPVTYSRVTEGSVLDHEWLSTTPKNFLLQDVPKIKKVNSSIYTGLKGSYICTI